MQTCAAFAMNRALCHEDTSVRREGDMIAEEWKHAPPRKWAGQAGAPEKGRPHRFVNSWTFDTSPQNFVPDHVC